MLIHFSRTLLHASMYMAIIVMAAPLSFKTAAAQDQLVPAQDAASLLGGERAQGAVIWSHGRSLQKECSLVPTPDYISAFRAAGWDTFRLNRPSIIDTLPDSAAVLAGAAEGLKQRGYRRIVLAGQSFGAFISLIAAGRSDAIDAVIGTAPAAYGSAESNPAGYAQNATRLYQLLGTVRRARVALFFFEGDIFDPGGRASIADEILAARGLAHLIVDRPAELPTHWAAATIAFAGQYGSCLAAFVGGASPVKIPDCGPQAALPRVAGKGGPPPSPARSRLKSLPQENLTSVIDLEIGGREYVRRGRALGRR